MHALTRTVALASLIILFTGAARAGGEYQGWEPLPRIADIRFNANAIGFLVAENAYVPGGPRYFELARGARDWRAIDSDTFYQRFPAHRLPAATTIRDEDTRTHFTLLATTDAEHFISTDYQCMEGFAHWAGIRRNGDWFPKHVDACVNIGAIESTGDYLLLGSTYAGEAGMFFGGQGIVAVDRASGKFVKGIGFNKNLQPSGMILALRRDPFTEDVWAATTYGLWRIGADLELKERLHFADVMDESGEVTTRLAASVKADPLAQFVRAMDIREPQAVYAFLKARCTGEEYGGCGYNLMYSLGMSSGTNWYLVPGAKVLLPHFLEAAAYANNGKPSLPFIEELMGFLHPCTKGADNLTAYREEKRNAAFRDALECFKVAGIHVPAREPVPVPEPPRETVAQPATSRFASPPREGLIRREGHDDVKIHAAWFAWRGEYGDDGQYRWQKQCVDFDTTRAGSDGYYRFEAWHFERPGNWFGAETEFRVEADNARLEEAYSEAPKLFALPPGRLVRGKDHQAPQRLRALAARCQADGVNNADVLAVLDATAAPAFAATPAPERLPLLHFTHPARGAVKAGESSGTVNIGILFYGVLDPASFRASFLGVDVSEQFKPHITGIQTVRLSAPPGRHQLLITARRLGADPASPPETFTFPVVLETSAQPAVRASAIQGTIQPIEFDPNRPETPILKPETSVEMIDIPVEEGEQAER